MRSRLERQLGPNDRAGRRRWEGRLAIAGFLFGAAVGALAGLFGPARPQPEAPAEGRPEPRVPAATRGDVRRGKQPA
jgi:hypothetical protein